MRPQGSPISSRPLLGAIPRTAPGPKLCPNVALTNTTQHQKMDSRKWTVGERQRRVLGGANEWRHDLSPLKRSATLLARALPRGRRHGRSAGAVHPSPLCLGQGGHLATASCIVFLACRGFRGCVGASERERERESMKQCMNAYYPYGFQETDDAHDPVFKQSSPRPNFDQAPKSIS